MRKHVLILLGGLTAAGVAHATPNAPSVPTWRQLEADHEQDHGTAAARRDMLSALPPGTSLRDAQAALARAGASCRPDRRRTGVTRCLIHQYDLGDGAADDIRWRISVESRHGVLTGMAVARDTDRHGTP